MNPSIIDTIENLTLDPEQLNQRSKCCLINRPKEPKKSDDYKEHKGRKQMVEGIVKEQYGDKKLPKSEPDLMWVCKKRPEAFW